MVSIRCKMIVKAELDKLGLRYGVVDLGEAEIQGNITTEQRDQLKSALLKSELELVDDKRAILIEKIKAVIVEMVHYEDEIPRTKIPIISVKNSSTITRTFPTCFQRRPALPSNTTSFRTK